MNIRRLAAWAGMLGNVLFVGVFTIEGWLRPGYNPRSMFVSELSLGPRGWIQISNFVVYGLLFLVFARGIAAEFRAGKASKAGPILLAIMGICFLVSGPLVMDPVATPHDQMTLHSRLHWLLGAIIFMMEPISCFVFLRRFWNDASWRSFRWWTLVVGVVTATALVIWSVGPTRPPLPPNVWNAWNGLLQRAILLPYSVWAFTLALGLYRRSMQPHQPLPAGRHV
ncbi:MAG TPA: DUF998 domain-containing protein [Roseiflexaceae bacterium]|nr:DUF998 domain-containing protein [Roseiflexaceae bacterium]